MVTNNNGPPSLYRNTVEPTGHWLGLRLRARSGNPDAVGAQVRLWAGGRPATRWVEAGSGYASQAPFVLHFGLGAATAAEEVEIRWPSGRVDRGRIEEVDRVVEIVEGEPFGFAAAALRRHVESHSRLPSPRQRRGR